MGIVVFTLVFLLAPALVLYLCGYVKFIGKMGPVLTLYLLGAFIGNLGAIPGVSMPENLLSLQHFLSSVTVPVAIPLMLIGCTFRKGEAGGHFMALLTGLFGVLVAVVLGFLVFGPSIDAGDASGNDSAAKIGGMLAGVYTGGTINLASLKTMLGVSDATYLLLNGYDMLIGFLYLVFLVSVGIKLIRYLLGNKEVHNDQVSEKSEEDPYKGLWSKRGLRVLAVLIVFALVLCGVSYGVAKLFPNSQLMTIFILMLTTLSIASSFVTKLRTLPYSYDVGMYCIYIFSIVVASMADITNLNLIGGIGMLGYLAFVVFVSMAVQVTLSKVLKIDSDVMIISSVACLCSPPFVPMISAAMRNKRVLAAGLAIGIVGYAAGNYLGFLIYRLLLLF